MEEKKIFTEEEKLVKLELVMNRTKVSFEDAKSALTACDWDALEAIIYLEKLGKAAPKCDFNFDEKKQKFEDTAGDLINDLKKLFKKSIDTKVEVKKDDKEVMSVPAIVPVAAAFVAPVVTIPLVAAGLLTDHKFSFKDTASAETEAAKAEVKEAETAEVKAEEAVTAEATDDNLPEE